MICVSYALLFFVGLSGLLEVGVRALQIVSLLRPYTSRRWAARPPQSPAQRPFVSVHVATHNEPPHLVIATLESLAGNTLADFEVIVVDNNTPDAAVWTPVAKAAAKLGERFKFVHVDGLSGAKAGALNVALSMADPRLTHIAIVDADYQVDAAFLQDAVDSLTAAGVDYVQFPQAYRGVGRAARGVEYELGDYFACFSRGAGRPGSMLPTGTLSVFAAPALKAVGGWPTETITEDARIGVLLQAAGYKGLWLARDRGRGLLPVDFQGLCKQRARWAAGNLQVLKSLCSCRWLRLDFADFLNLAAQLTSWVSLLLPAGVTLILVGVLPGLPLSSAIATTAAGTVLISAMLTALRMVFLSGRAVDWRVRLEACGTKIAPTWTSAVSWIPALIPHPLQFHRTAKAIGGKRDGEPVLAAVSLAFVAASAAYLARGQFIQTAACGLLASIWLCARAVDANLRRAASLNPELR
jgi:cellulose synthase/poly-beta-1,6-N-acetylglucosamine synthase-like glycosyltransferase